MESNISTEIMHLFYFIIFLLIIFLPPLIGTRWERVGYRKAKDSSGPFVTCGMRYSWKKKRFYASQSSTAD